MRFFLLGSIALLWSAAFSSSVGAEFGAENARLDPSSKRVLFLGDSITYSGAYTRFVETYFITRYPERPIEFINLGLLSENVSGLSEPGHGTKTVKFPRPDLHERLERVLGQIKPDLIFACYGMNDGIQLPFDEARCAAFQSGIRRLRDAARNHGATIIHLTPPVYDSHQPVDPGYDNVLARYSAWLLEQRSAGWKVIDLRGPMLAARAAGRAKDPAFTFSRDRVHPNEDGHWVMARAVLTYLGARDLMASDTPEGLVATVPEGARLATLIRQRSELVRDAWLTAIGHQRPGVKAGLPLAEAQASAAALSSEIASLVRVRAAR
jgi:lysophospholipase L1-like esterase